MKHDFSNVAHSVDQLFFSLKVNIAPVAKFINTICAMEDDKPRLSIERMFDNKSGALSLSVKRSPGFEAQDARKNKGDI